MFIILLITQQREEREAKVLETTFIFRQTTGILAFQMIKILYIKISGTLEVFNPRESGAEPSWVWKHKRDWLDTGNRNTLREIKYPKTVLQ